MKQSQLRELIIETLKTRPNYSCVKNALHGFVLKQLHVISRGKVTFLALFTNGFHWHLNELEDFVFFYFKGIHFPGGPFAQMEDYDVNEKKIRFRRTIDHFAYFRRPKTEMKPNKVIWNVKLPCIPD